MKAPDNYHAVRRQSLSEPVLPSVELLQAAAVGQDGSDGEDSTSNSSLSDKSEKSEKSEKPVKPVQEASAKSKEEPKPRPARRTKEVSIHEDIIEEWIQEIDDQQEIPEEIHDEEEEYGECDRPTARAQRTSRRRGGRLVTLSEFNNSKLKVDVANSGTFSVPLSVFSEEQVDCFFGDGKSGVGAPAPRRPVEARSPEMERQRLEAMRKVASISKKYAQQLEKQKEAAQARRRRRLKTAPSSVSGADLSVVRTASNDSMLCSVAAGVEPVFIFDWDDTLFPTWYTTDVVKACHGKEGPLPKDSSFYEPLRAHGQVIRATLTSAREVGRVFIVTLARRPWVNTSADWYLPDLDIEQLLTELGIEVYYAREHVGKPQVCMAQLEEGVDMFEIAKRNAMLKCLKKHYGSYSRTMHVVCVGDSPVEQEAIQEVVWCCHQEAKSFCKTVKLMSDPTVENLSEELQVLTSWFCQMAAYDNDFNVSMETAEDMDNITGIIGGDL
eukprot:gb/GFBE01015234.1/.p1 GENE.gb/GFBE01015234.1/~~gb/GFBE01015234.1/.p1  ORF type:complete len:497 (+),score=96.68 gb/GFBE01015234.1/:1-1491(+)